MKIKIKNHINLLSHINKPIFNPENIEMCKIVFDSGELKTHSSCPHYRGGGHCNFFNESLDFIYPTRAYRSKNCLSNFEVENE